MIKVKLLDQTTVTAQLNHLNVALEELHLIRRLCLRNNSISRSVAASLGDHLPTGVSLEHYTRNPSMTMLTETLESLEKTETNLLSSAVNLATGLALNVTTWISTFIFNQENMRAKLSTKCVKSRQLKAIYQNAVEQLDKDAKKEVEDTVEKYTNPDLLSEVKVFHLNILKGGKPYKVLSELQPVMEEAAKSVLRNTMLLEKAIGVLQAYSPDKKDDLLRDISDVTVYPYGKDLSKIVNKYTGGALSEDTHPLAFLTQLSEFNASLTTVSANLKELPIKDIESMFDDGEEIKVHNEAKSAAKLFNEAKTHLSAIEDVSGKIATVDPDVDNAFRVAVMGLQQEYEALKLYFREIIRVIEAVDYLADLQLQEIRRLHKAFQQWLSKTPDWANAQMYRDSLNKE